MSASARSCRDTWRSDVTVDPPGYQGSRATATGIYYLLGPGEESGWHRVASDELWLWHRGGPLLLAFGGDAEAPDDVVQHALGADVERGQLPQLVATRRARHATAL
ncbi:MAG: hypothetical protein GEU83_15025 [Pseudonocardiaceae bacterium]|nr:hypothetical protein [Pseudonocardiaceae bacterium]